MDNDGAVECAVLAEKKGGNGGKEKLKIKKKARLGWAGMACPCPRLCKKGLHQVHDGSEKSDF